MTAISIAEGVRAAAVRFYPRCPTLRNRCGPCSFALLVCLQGLGFDAALAWGFYGRKSVGHYWVESGDRILDVTAGQFHRPAREAVQVVASDDGRYRRWNRFRDSTEALGFLPTFVELDGFAIATAFCDSLVWVPDASGKDGGR